MMGMTPGTSRGSVAKGGVVVPWARTMLLDGEVMIAERRAKDRDLIRGVLKSILSKILQRRYKDEE
jgi:hypothetical protein